MLRIIPNGNPLIWEPYISGLFVSLRFCSWSLTYPPGKKKHGGENKLTHEYVVSRIEQLGFFGNIFFPGPQFSLMNLGGAIAPFSVWTHCALFLPALVQRAATGERFGHRCFFPDTVYFADIHISSIPPVSSSNPLLMAKKHMIVNRDLWKGAHSGSGRVAHIQGDCRCPFAGGARAISKA